jgi:hypothetical protein
MSTHEKGDGNSNEQMTKEGNKSTKRNIRVCGNS